MEGYPIPAVERAMKVQEVILKAISGQLQWWQAAEILGVSCRTMRRWKTRYQQRGYDGLLDRRRHRPSPKRMPLATVQRVLRLYQEQYQGFNVAHFCDQLREQHGLSVSYQWVKDRTANGWAGHAPGPSRVAITNAATAVRCRG